MYRLMELRDELRELRERVKNGEQNQATVDRIYEIEMEIANIYYTDLG